ncbi:MAG TPA: bacillithiol biosynthesis cysteine-adding enzyme BshC [Candidatus Saccharimonadales bacterium]|nr:bacillithiol biosynthesis cysteine-adding enzyme BshC [Candidatus Saccharimonadales bacterium]
MKTECMPFTAIPHNSRLFLDFLFQYDKVASFYQHRPHSQAVLEHARTLQFPAERRAKVADVLEKQNRRWGASDAAMASIEKFRKGAVACISGQQVGVFGGPLYSILKAASALQMAEELSAEGIPAIPIFWLATEDHDLEEIASVTLPNGCELEKLTSAGQNGSDAPVGSIALDARMTAMVERATALLGPGWVSDALRESYRLGETYGSAFARLFTRIMSGTGMVLVDPLDNDLHAIVQPLFSAAAERAEELDQALLERGKALHKAGYHEQVRVTPESTLLFSLESNRRTVLHLAGEEFMLGAQRVPRREMLDRISAHPEQFSANVLLRPVVQDYLFPTAVYFGGPAEIAYFAQAGVVYEKLLGRTTPVMPRLSATIVNSTMSDLLVRYRLSFSDLFHGSERVCELLASRVLAPGLRNALQSTKESLEANLAELREELRKLDPTLVDAASRSERKMLYQLSKIGSKAARAELRQSESLIKDAHRVLTELFPHKELQERVLPGIYFLAQYGPELITELKKAAAPQCPGHQIIRLESSFQASGS